MATFKLLLGLGRTVVLLGIAGARPGSRSRTDEPPDLSPALVTAACPFCTTMPTGASSYGATTAATSEQ